MAYTRCDPGNTIVETHSVRREHDGSGWLSVSIRPFAALTSDAISGGLNQIGWKVEDVSYQMRAGCDGEVSHAVIELAWLPSEQDATLVGMAVLDLACTCSIHGLSDQGSF